MTATSLYAEINPTEEIISCCLQIEAEWRCCPVPPNTLYLWRTIRAGLINHVPVTWSVLNAVHLSVCFLKYLFTCLFMSTNLIMSRWSRNYCLSGMCVIIKLLRKDLMHRLIVLFIVQWQICHDVLHNISSCYFAKNNVIMFEASWELLSIDLPVVLV